ncbi:MAG: response regulator transcription factor [Pannonibacter indicus]|mgnify:CR=1 FL=1
MTHVLLIEDDTRIAGFLTRGLRAEGFNVRHAANGSDGLQAARELQAGGESAVVILDLMLPDIHGLDLCRTLRRQGIGLPVLMLTAMRETTDRVTGLRMGADDYLCKPFDFEELLARIEALTRRAGLPQASAGPAGSTQVTRLGSLLLDRNAMTATCRGTPLDLTATELRMLMTFAAAPGRLFSRERLLAEVWEADRDPLTNVIDVYVARLRKKIGKGPDLPKIQTLRGLGYRLILPSDSADPAH